MTETTDHREHGVNVPLLRKVLEHVTAHPEEHDQGSWAQRTQCGTAFCLAGHVVLAEGYEIDWSELPPDDEGDVDTVAGTDVRIPWIAARALRIGYEHGDGLGRSGHLFSSSNSLPRLWQIASELTDGEITVPVVLPDGAA